MKEFPRTEVGGLSLSRMIIGTNWFLGYSHTTKSKDRMIKERVRNRETIADILEVFFEYGVDTLMAPITEEPTFEAIKEAEDRTGVGATIIGTPTFSTGPRTPEEGFDEDEAARILDEQVEHEVDICMPHQSTTDSMVDRCRRKVRRMDQLCRMIREREMVPGLSTHMPETITYADESGLDVETYISIYNSMGFLMQVEVDWVARIIRDADKPVMTIKPMAAGQVRPFQAFNFVWNTIRDQDMVTVGTMTPGEARECVEMSLDILERRESSGELQETRSKQSVKRT